MEGVCEDGDRVGDVSTHELDGHEEERHKGDLDELGAHLFMLFIHRI